ncbi:LOW QUALITY PROTEIN: Hypothetical protein PHPALM_6652 [Phytophthora palmivora]|uniref:Uncharacterized protein n=1 Tax=Phytophthora palmivora TaxID=4796 RepID=A0A2P4YEA6_9STRA|nr:LOW QUALITY PROTEIN: Hypothetical protein PHPALM_6652 [Phytophthora palmivora]
MTQGSNAKLESYFQAAMSRFLKEQEGPINPAIVAPAEDRDVDGDRHPSPHEYDPDDLDLDPPRRATVASASATTTGRSTSVPRIRVSAMSELKVFAGKEGDEDRARAWLNKVKSALCEIKLQTRKSAWCSAISSQDRRETGIDSLVAQHAVPGRICSATSKFNIVDEEFARQYYHARKRSDESPLEYLYRLNVAGLRARLQIKDGPSEVRREHVEHFIETLDDRDLADHLALLRIPDADTLEEALRSRQRAKARQSKAVYGSIKPPVQQPRLLQLGPSELSRRSQTAASRKRTLVDRMAKQDYVVSTLQHLETTKDSKIKVKRTKIAAALRLETIVHNKIDMI